MSFCSNCGARTGSDSFCGECGTAIDVEPKTAKPSVASTASHIASAPAGVSTARSAVDDDAASEHSRRMGTLFVCSTTLSRGPRGAQLIAELRRRTTLIDVLLVDAQDALTRTQARLNELSVSQASSKVDAVCLVGSDATLPHARIDDRTGRGEYVLTDNFFGRVDTPDEDERMAGDLLAHVPVSRLPFDDAEVIIELLRRPDVLSPTWNNGVLVSCEVWRGASAAVVEHLGAVERLHLAPPSTNDHVDGLLAASPGRLYFNVHGTDVEPVWVGQGHDGHHPEVLRSSMISVAPGAVVVSEACFGAACFEGEEAIGQAFLTRGASAFFGSTIIAWGPPQAPPGLADLIPIHVYQQLDAGRSASEALQAAKRAICDDYLERDEVLCAQVENTLLSFCHYGFPWCRSTTRPQSGRKPPGVPNGAKSATTRSKTPSLLSSLRSGSSGVLGRVRAGVADKASRQGWGVDTFLTAPLEDIAATLGPLAHLLDRIRTQSGPSTGTGVLTRYRSRVGERITLTVEDAGARGVIRGLIADEKGAVLEEFVSRSRPSSGAMIRRAGHTPR